MAKLYWRVKRNSKWTWTPLVITTDFEQKLVERWALTITGEEE